MALTSNTEKGDVVEKVSLTSDSCSESDDRKKNEPLPGASSTLSTYLLLLGYSIGLSDIWRFPFLVYRNGGGAFLIPFVLTILVCGAPVYFTEFFIGQFSGKAIYGMWDISPIFRGIGIMIPVAYTMFFMGNSIFRCWMLEFLVNSFKSQLPWMNCNNTWNTGRCVDNTFTDVINNTEVTPLTHSTNPYSGNYSSSYNANNATYNVSLMANHSEPVMSSAEEFWLYKVLELSGGMTDFYPIQWRYVVFMLICRVAVFLCLVKGIKSMEQVVKITTCVPLLLTVAVLVQSLTLPGARAGLYHFFYPDFSKLLHISIWIEAFMMAFYTLGFGWGALIYLGSQSSYVARKSVRSTFILVMLDAGFAIFSGMTSFSVLGNMAHAYGIDVTEVIDAGLSTGIISYVTALSTLPFPNVWCVLFFISVFLTGLDGQMIPVEMCVQNIMEMFPSLRKIRIKVLIVFSFLLFIGALPTCTGAGGYIFLFIDWYVAAWIGPNVALIEVFVVSWVYGTDRFNSDVVLMSGRQIPTVLRLLLAWITPVVIGAIFLSSCLEYAPPKLGSYIYPANIRIFGWILVVLLQLPLLVYAGYKLVQSDGSFIKRLKHTLSPNFKWGPVDARLKVDFEKEKTKFKARTSKDLLYFNVLGRYPADSLVAKIENQEKELKHRLDDNTCV